jgi:hypothetical protein
MLGGSLSRCLKCGLLVGRRGVSGDGIAARRARWSRRLLSNAPARKQLRLGIARPFIEASDLAESPIVAPLGGFSTREPESLAPWLEARSKNSGVQWVREAIAHIGRTFVFDVHVELAGVREQEVHDGAVVCKLSSRECQLKRALFIEFFQPRTSLVRDHACPSSFSSTDSIALFSFCSQKSNSAPDISAIGLQPRQLRR